MMILVALGYKKCVPAYMRLRRNAFYMSLRYILFTCLTVAAHKLVYATSRVNKFALARIERV